jgi:DNA-binding NtrC family response regulator
MSSHTRMLLVDADASGGSALLQLLGPAGYEARRADDAPHALLELSRSGADVVLFSLDAGGLAGLTRLAAAAPDAEFVLLASASQRSLAREGLKLGACDVVERTGDMEAFFLALERAAREGRMRREVAMLRARLREDAQQALVGRSAGMAVVRDLVGRAAASRMTVVVTGEPGTGKDVVARLVHDLSDRTGRPFVTVRCEDADPAALEEELFGGERGGLLETARGGTLVIDEVGSVPRALRARIAAMLDERVVRRADGTVVPVDLRVVLTSRTAAGDAHDAAAEPLLRERSVLTIALPPLRDRRSDIPMLVQHFRRRAAGAKGVEPPALPLESMNSLMGHQWPGNVRELEHRMERMAYAAANGSSAKHGASGGRAAQLDDLDAAQLTLDELERKYILHVLELERGHQSRAAERLGIDRRTLYRKLKEYRDDSVSVRRVG